METFRTFKHGLLLFVYIQSRDQMLKTCKQLFLIFTDDVILSLSTKNHLHEQIIHYIYYVYIELSYAALYIITEVCPI
jgi:hypothetical protein